MPSRRSRSRSRSRNRSASPERRYDLPKGVEPISESDYFQKSDEFRLWLKEEKSKYFDELSGDRARRYALGRLDVVESHHKTVTFANTYYNGIAPGTIPAAANTSYKWSFASKRTRADEEALRAARDEITAATTGDRHGRSDSGPSSRPQASSSRLQGPTLPSASDITLARELQAEQREEERAYRRKKEKLEAKERIEDMVGPKPVGREGMLEKKRMQRENNRAFRERGDEGLELDDSTLMGGGDSFQAQLARRDMAKSRFAQKEEERQNTMRERASAYKEKEKATMDMFQQLAKQRFG
ncbi:hypothetical protein CVT24_012675 [Panaeolus cyanescens]|uniref:Uncharacterized protein n=1 Tax=Panaeolus cyanescens TaxID=181874 RepID=A0A409YK66_9AGAR|nr:hypothetical protein CVT24_012675 [Panaeolus cyanescens]